eukprot:1149106-Pelagomonas_calceolata.AAC.4
MPRQACAHASLAQRDIRDDAIARLEHPYFAHYSLSRSTYTYPWAWWLPSNDRRVLLLDQLPLGTAASCARGRSKSVLGSQNMGKWSEALRQKKKQTPQEDGSNSNASMSASFIEMSPEQQTRVPCHC